MRILVWELPVTRQCDKCPWRVDTNLLDIKNYSRDEHEELVTLADKPGPVEVSEISDVSIMACHESPLGDEYMCLGWLMNQLGIGNNIKLRKHCLNCTNLNDVVLRGEQHKNIKDTLPPTH